MPKSAVKPMNSSKNKLNNEIILIFHSYPNACLNSNSIKPIMGSNITVIISKSL